MNNLEWRMRTFLARHPRMDYWMRALGIMVLYSIVYRIVGRILRSIFGSLFD